MSTQPPLPPLDADAGLVSVVWDAGSHLEVEVRTAGEALDRQHEISRRGWVTVQDPYDEDQPDEMHVADDGRPIAVFYSAAARRQLDDTA